MSGNGGKSTMLSHEGAQKIRDAAQDAYQALDVINKGAEELSTAWKNLQDKIPYSQDIRNMVNEIMEIRSTSVTTVAEMAKQMNDAADDLDQLVNRLMSR